MLQALLIIFVYIVGPALALTWAVKRYRTGVKADFTEIVAVSTAVVLIGVLIFNYSGNVSDTDQADMQIIIKDLTASYSFPVRARFEDRPAVDGVAHPRYLEVRIYGVMQPGEQDKIATLLKKLRREIASKPVIINFFGEEIWEELPDGSRRPLRDKEQPVRNIRLE